MKKEIYIPKTTTNTCDIPLNVWAYSQPIVWMDGGNHYWHIGYKIIPAKDMWEEYGKEKKIKKKARKSSNQKLMKGVFGKSFGN